MEKSFRKLQEVFPDHYQGNQLKECLFHGVNQQTRDAMRYLCDKKSTIYEVLLTAIKDAETKWIEAKGQVRMKSAVVPEQSELDELKERMDKLQAMVKSATVQKEKEKKKTRKTSPQKEDPRTKTKGPATTLAGPFRPDQKPIQCYKCEGWGHGWCKCEPNEAPVIIENVQVKGLVDSWAQISSISDKLAKHLELKIHKLETLLDLEPTGGDVVPYEGYVELRMQIPGIAAFDLDVLMLVISESEYANHVPVTIGMLHIDEIIGLITDDEL